MARMVADVTASVALERAEPLRETQFIRCSCGQAVAIRVAKNTYRSLGADTMASVSESNGPRQVFVCPVCGRRVRAAIGTMGVGGVSPK